jgi:hypothetical protein
MSNLIDTRRVQTRRILRFESLEDVRRDVQRLAEADRAGRLERLGNWTLGQTLGHLSTWIGYSYERAPLNPPWVVRFIVKLRKKKMLNDKMPVGVKIPGVDGGTLGTEPISTEEGVSRYTAALDRLTRETPTAPSVIFGHLTHDEWIKLNLRHAELHLGFLKEKN